MPRTEETLDPKDWDAFADLAHRMVDDVVEHLRGVRDRPAWQPYPDDVGRRILDEPVPYAEQGEQAVYQDFLELVQPYPNGNLSPHFWGWVQGPGLPYGVLADMLASGLNSHLAGYNQTPVLIEEKVVDWFREIFGFPPGATGLMLSGGSMANFTALAVARNAQAGFDIRRDGLAGSPVLTVYAADEVHSWVFKAAEVLGLGREAVRLVPRNPDFTLDLAALKEQIDRDRKSGRHPIALVATAGTVNTGAFDDLEAAADLCVEQGLWLHVDGAFGALVALSPELRHLVKGLERADSVAFDLHKWMYLPFEIACVLVRDGTVHRAAFAQTANYLVPLDRGPVAGGFPFADLGLELTRSFKALKAWMSLKAYGVDAFARLIEQNVDQARYLEKLVKERPKLELLAPVTLNIVCFRHRFSGAPEEVDRLNAELLMRIQERGIAVPSSTVIDGRFAVRVCIVNHRTRREDLDVFVAAVLTVGGELQSGASQF